MKAIVLIISILLLVSCSPENLWQKTGIVSPEPISIQSKTGSPDSSDENKVDVVRSFVGNRDSSISFSIDKPEDFTGSILYPQSKAEAEAMAQMLNAKCFGKDKIREFLASKIEDESLVAAMKNTVTLLEKGKRSLINVIVNFLPEFPVEEDTDETIKEIIETYNSIKDGINNSCTEFIKKMFDPLFDILSSSEDPTWGEYVKCQLMVNLLSGVLEGMENTVNGVMNVLSSEEMGEVLYNLGNEDDNNELNEKLYEVGVSALLEIASGVVSSVLSPIAIYNSVSYNYGKDIGLMSISDIFDLIEV